MIGDLTEAQRELADYMSWLSERAYAAGWMLGIEVELWNAVQRGPVRCGMLQLDDQHLARLKALSERCEGWIYFDEEREESFASIAEWHSLMARRPASPRTDVS